MILLSQFLLRISFGLAVGMALTSSRQVTSGYFRNHLYVLLGFNVLATLAAVSQPVQLLLWPPLAAAVLSYFGAVAWLYEQPRAGKSLLWAVAGCTLVGALSANPHASALTESGDALNSNASWLPAALSR